MVHSRHVHGQRVPCRERRVGAAPSPGPGNGSRGRGPASDFQKGLGKLFCGEGTTTGPEGLLSSGVGGRGLSLQDDKGPSPEQERGLRAGLQTGTAGAGGEVLGQCRGCGESRPGHGC